MQIPEIKLTNVPTLPIEIFKEMDLLAVEKYNLPTDLMMENAGLKLAGLATFSIPHMWDNRLAKLSMAVRLKRNKIPVVATSRHFIKTVDRVILH